MPGWVIWGVGPTIAGAILIAVPFLTVENSNKIFPPPLTYPDQPTPIEDPSQPGVALPLDATPQVHAGDTLITLPTRCATDDGGTGLGVLPFTYTRALYTPDGTRVLDASGGSATADVGCHQVRSDLQEIPDSAQPGVYYIGGTATAVGEHRAATIAWRTAQFEIVP